MRTFVAVWPTGEVVEALRALPRPASQAVRWTVPEQCHVTMAFLGEVEQERASAVGEVLRSAVAPRTAVVAVMGPATTVLSGRVLCVPVAGLDELARRLQGGLDEAGFFVEERPFRAHLTVGRARGRKKLPPRLAGVAIAASWPVEQVLVVASTLNSDGPRYEVIDRVALGAPPAADEVSSTTRP